jgi:DNA-binding XRE family transcriptional regulator
MYEQEVGPIPDSLELDHLCRQPSCVNPAHLEPVTAATNSRRGFARLSADDVAEIRRTYAAGSTTQRSIAERFGVSQQTISDIVRGNLWR